MVSHRDVIQSLGGPSALARVLGLSVVNTTGKWPRRGIPPVYWHRIAQIAATKGLDLTAEDLEGSSPLRTIAHLQVGRNIQEHSPAAPSLDSAQGTSLIQDSAAHVLPASIPSQVAA